MTNQRENLCVATFEGKAAEYRMMNIDNDFEIEATCEMFITQNLTSSDSGFLVTSKPDNTGLGKDHRFWAYSWQTAYGWVVEEVSQDIAEQAGWSLD